MIANLLLGVGSILLVTMLSIAVSGIQMLTIQMFSISVVVKGEKRAELVDWSFEPRQLNSITSRFIGQNPAT
jgi:hypothetical protein